MAHRMKWLFGTLIALTAISAFVQTLDISFGESWQRKSFVLQRQIASAETALRETVWADTALSMLPVTPGVHVRVLGKVHDSADARLRRLVAEEWNASGGERARIGVVVLPSSLGAYAHRFVTDRNPPPTYFAGSDAAGTYCLVLVARHESDGVLDSPVATRTANTPPLLGPCRWWARYGVPGPQIAEWLRNRGGYYFGTQAALADAQAAPVRASTYFARGTQYSGLSPFALACVRGRTDACTGTFVNPLVLDGRTAAMLDAQQSAAIFRAPRWWLADYPGAEATMLSQLEDQFGAQRFARFWTSAQPVASAFHDAFGTSVGEWVHTWATTRFADVRNEQRRAGLTLLLSFITLGLLFTAALIDAQRRQIR